MTTTFPSPAACMQRALELAQQGAGTVEPNPMVGAVVVNEQLALLGEGWHERFGGPHAEVHALAQAGAATRGATLYVTLEPCCHVGKTPPCVDAILQSGVSKVVVAMQDPFPAVGGKGIARLQAAGVAVEVGLLEEAARSLTAPFRKLVETSLPWVHAKWAMTLDGRIASRTGHSQWISNDASRGIVHALRGRMDGIVVGIGTALADDPLLTARPPGPRVATRIIVDSRARLPLDSRLVRTAARLPLLVVVGHDAPAERIDALRAAGAEVLTLPVAGEGTGSTIDLHEMMRSLGTRRFTNVLVEGGGQLLGSLFDANLIDEAHVFIAPKLVGGALAKGALEGAGRAEIPQMASLRNLSIERLGEDLYVHGRLHA